jgi:hypothetical protein
LRIKFGLKGEVLHYSLIKVLQTYQLDLRNKVKISCVEGKKRQLSGNRCRRDEGIGNLQIMAFGITFDEIPGEGRDRFVNLNDLIIRKGFFNASDLMQIKRSDKEFHYGNGRH